MNVRALPTCRNPVGEGAKRTRGFDPEDKESRDSGINSRTHDGMGRENNRQAGPATNRALKSLIPRAARKQRQFRPLSLNSIVLAPSAVKTLVILSSSGGIRLS